MLSTSIVNKSDNINEIYTHFSRDKNMKLTQEEIQNLNRDITCKEIELLNLNLPIKKSLAP